MSFPQTTSRCHDLFSNITTISPADVEMDTLSISGPQSTGDPRASSSINQPDLAVPGQPTSEMVEDKRKPDEHATFDADINKSFSSTWLDIIIGNQSLLEANLLPLLVTIAQQNNYTIDLATAANMMEQKQYEWLRDFLIGKWRGRSFTEARRLSECPLCTFPVLRATFFLSRNPTPININIFIIHRCYNVWSW